MGRPRLLDGAVRTRRLLAWVDDRVGGARWARSALRHVFPDHFSFMLGEVALYCFVILVITGTYLSLFFHASHEEVVYTGSYVPLRGVHMSEAYESVVRISQDERFGLVIRQIHHWAALVFVMAIVLHVSRVFFTGAFRRPRELNWIVGVTLLLLTLANGFLGYSLLDDLLSGTGLRIAYSMAESIPVIGLWTASLFFGGEFPTTSMIPRMFFLHVFVVPAAIAGLLGIHLALIWRQKHTQFPGRRQREDNVVGSRLWPTYAARSVALLLGVFGVLALLGGLVQINPVWLWGPYDPATVTQAAQPDWYVGWLEGALRLFPNWEVNAFGYQIPNPFFPGVLLPLLTFAGLYVYPFVERRLTGDDQEHELLDRPRDRPFRTAFGAGVLTFYVVLFVAGSHDVLATWVGLSVQAVTWVLRVLLFVLPVVVGVVAHRWCLDLAEGRNEPVPVEAHGS
jgi:quinol---cytochrome-c reductase cytochrome b subunit